MSKLQFIGGMGATHTDHDKLIKVVQEAQRKSTVEMVRANDEPLLYDFIDRHRLDPNIKINKNIKYVAEEKIDGFSYLNTDGRFLSKRLSEAKGNEGNPIDKTEWMPHLEENMRRLYERFGVDLHGELYVPGGTSDDVTSILGCTQFEAVRKQISGKKLHFKIIDIRKYLGINITHLPQYARRALLEELQKIIEGIDPNGYISISDIVEDPVLAFKQIVSNGGEGLVFKKTSGLYVPDKKPADNWIKAKKSITLDAFIMGFNDGGSGKNKDLFKSIRIGIILENTDGTQTEQYIGDVHSGVSDQLRAEMHNNREGFLGRVIEVEAMDYNPKRYSCRHARLIKFRDDKHMYDCGTDGIKVITDLLL